MHNISLKNEIIKLLVVFTFVVSILIASISSYSLYNTELESLTHSQKQVLSHLKYEINALLNNIEDISAYLDKEHENQHGILEYAVSLNTNITSIIILNKEGIVKDVHEQDMLNIYKGFDYSHKKYFTVFNNNNILHSWSDAFLINTDGTLSLSYSYKADDGDIIIIFLQLKDLLLFSKKFVNDDGSHLIRIFDDKGTLILNPDNKERVYRRFNASSTSLFKNMINKVDEFEQALFQSKSFETVANKGKSQIAMYSIIKKTGWILVVREGYSSVLKNLKFLLIIISVILFLFLFFSLMIAIRSSKKIFQSIEFLNLNISSMANGNYKKYIISSPYLEFDVLINNFKKMQVEIDKREVSLEKSLISFKSLVNSTMEAIIIHENEVCIDVNDVAVKMFGYDSKEDMMGHKYLDFFSVKSKLLIESNLDKDTEAYEFEPIRKNGNTFTALGKSKFLILNDKKTKVSTIIDISELKNKDKLLSQQSKMASMGEMLENIAHQWRQPLSIISTAASGVKLEEEFDILTKDKLHEYLDVVINNTQHLSKTIDDFRNFLKDDKEAVQFSISSVISHIILLLDSDFIKNEITLIKDIDNSIRISSYPNELTQALISIFTNSKDACIQQNITNRYLHISVYQENDHAIICIEDNAGGIDDSIITKVFEPYFTTKHKAQGTGIGLYMTHQIIVDHMKGSIEVKNSTLLVEKRVQKGCTFIIKLPLCLE